MNRTEQKTNTTERKTISQSKKQGNVISSSKSSSSSSSFKRRLGRKTLSTVNSLVTGRVGNVAHIVNSYLDDGGNYHDLNGLKAELNKIPKINAKSARRLNNLYVRAYAINKQNCIALINKVYSSNKLKPSMMMVLNHLLNNVDKTLLKRIGNNRQMISSFANQNIDNIFDGSDDKTFGRILSVMTFPSRLFLYKKLVLAYRNDRENTFLEEILIVEDEHKYMTRDKFFSKDEQNSRKFKKFLKMHPNCSLRSN
jgi:hypothetical protein